MYKYYNRNPKQERVPDCVCRAISLATESNYNDVAQLLRENGIDGNCEELCVDCYSEMLKRIGFEKYDAERKTVGKLAREHRNKRLLIRIHSHLTCSVFGNVYDIWDCTGKIADVFWIID